MLLVSTGDNFLRLFALLIMFVFVIALTYYSSKWIAGYQKTQMINKNLEIIEGMRLAGNKYLCIVRVGRDRYFLVGLGKDDVHLLGEVSADELKELPVPGGTGGNGRKNQSFDEVLRAFKKRIKK